MKKQIAFRCKVDAAVAAVTLAASWSVWGQTSMKTGTTSVNENCKPGEFCPITCEDLPPTPGKTDPNAGGAKRNVRSDSNTGAPAGANSPSPAQVWQGLRIRYQATWSLVSGQPGKINYCVKPEVQILGNTPWVSPLSVSLTDDRSVEYPNEDPNNPVVSPKVLLTQQPHVKAS